MPEPTHQDRSGRRRALQRIVTSAFAESLGTERVVAEILEGACRALEWSAGTLWRVDSTARELRSIGVWVDPALRATAFEEATRIARFERGVGLPGRVWRRGAPAWIADVGQDANFPRAQDAAGAGLRTALGVPILLEGEVLGVMEFFHREVLEPDEELLELLVGVGAQLGQYLRRTQAEEAVREREAHFRAALESAETGTWELEPGSGREVWSEGLFRLYGLDPERVVPSYEAWLELLHPEDRERMDEAHRQDLRRGAVRFSDEFRILHPTRGVRWMLSRGRISYRDDGTPDRVTGTIVDISERKHAELALQEMNAELERRVEERTRELAEAQAFVSGVLDSSLDGIAALRSVRDGAGEIVDFEWLLLNRQAQRLLGPASADFVGRRLLETLPGNRELGLFDAYIRVVETGDPVSNEFPYNDDGLRGWYQNTAVKLGDGFVVTFRDITRQKEEERAREALTATQLGTYEYRPDSHRVVVSAGTAAIFGLPESEGPREVEAILARLHPDDREAAQETLRSYREGKEGHRMEYRIVRPDGTLRWIQARGKVMWGADGEVERVLGVVLDITDRKEAEIALQEANRTLEARVLERTAQLQGTNRELEAFSYSVSHDLRAPLRSIDGFSQALLEEYASALGEDGRAYLARVQGGVERMRELIDAMLVLARHTQRELRLREIDLSRLAREVAGELREREPGREVDLRVEEGLRAWGDPHLLRATLENLLSNAFKYTRASRPARVTVGALRERGETAFFVRDNGVGFDPSCVERLFKPFSRLHPREEFEGTGIGLATVQRVIHRHGGRVWAEGEPGEGSTFYFTLPAAGERRAGGAGSG